MKYDYNKATHDWVRKTHKIDDDVEVVDIYLKEDHCYCETCGPEPTTIVAKLRYPRYPGPLDVDLGTDVVGMIREVSELIASNPSEYVLE